MKIPIFNSIYNEKNVNIKSSKLNLNILNNLNFSSVNLKKFPSIKILNKIPKKISLYETVLVSANDQLVDLFLKNKISFQKITFFLNKILIKKNFLKYRNRSPKNYNEIIKLSNYVRLKTRLLCI
jgi:1-deoxy-D-xylulose-5-phosphate reductoisomerase